MRKLFLAATAAMLMMSGPMQAADHNETPSVGGDPAADIADVYFFRAGGKVVGAITFGNRPAPASRIDVGLYCDPNVLYTFNIARGSNNTTPDLQVFARFGKNAVGTCGLQLTGVPGATAAFSGQAETVFTSPSGLKAYAGLRDDPFFFDFQGFGATLANFTSNDATPPSKPLAFAPEVTPGAPPRDSFAGRNCSVIVFEMDPAAVYGSATSVHAWATTSRIPG